MPRLYADVTDGPRVSEWIRMRGKRATKGCSAVNSIKVSIYSRFEGEICMELREGKERKVNTIDLLRWLV